MFNNVCVIGLGYIGLPTAAAFASRKVAVRGVDVNPFAVEKINRGEIHIVEPDLDVIVRGVVRDGYLRAASAPDRADAFLIAVPTPFRSDHSPDLSYVESAAASIAPHIKKGDLVVLESTSPVGTTEKLAAWLQKKRPDLRMPELGGEEADIRIAYCPERVLPGKIMRELVENDRVIGGMTTACSQAASELYSIFVEGRLEETTVRTAELCKLSENAYRDVNIAFANELSLVCDHLDIDVWELRRVANLHPRVNILEPGPGVGGHCIAVDPWFIAHSAREQSKLIRTAREVNDGKPRWVVEKVLEEMPKSGGTVACFGLAYKPDVDDLRESPAVTVVKALAEITGVKVLAVEPNIAQLPASLDDLGVELVAVDEALQRASLLVGLVKHSGFAGIDVSSGRHGVIDVQNIWPAPSGAEPPQ